MMFSSNKQGKQVAILLLELGLVGMATAGGHSPKPEAQSLYKRGRFFLNSGKVDSAIACFEEATREDRKFADAWNGLGLAYMELGTLQGRLKATHALEHALRLDWENPEYNYNMGILHVKKGMHSAAAGFFKKILKRHPDFARSYYQLGRLAEEQMLRYKDMISPQEDGVVFYLTRFAEKDRLKAENYYRRSIDLDPTFSDAYYRLALVDYEVRDLEGMIGLLHRALRAAPDSASQRRKDYDLFLGLAYHRMGRAEDAFTAFEEARDLMDEEELALFDSVEVVMTPRQAKYVLAASDDERIEMRDRFWKQRDPLFLTKLNERLLEHYARIAYANLRFSFPEKGIIGWKTDRGRTLIRFGEPEVLYRTRPYMEVAFGTNPLHTSKEYWGYPDFHIVFDDEFLNGNYRFLRGWEPENDYKYQYEELIKDKPDYYHHDYGGERFDVPRLIASFRGEEGKTKLEIFYGVPGHRIALNRQGGLSTARLQRGLFFFDPDWHEVRRSVDDRSLVLQGGYEDGEPLYLIDRQQQQIKPGTYNFALELLDKESKNVGIVRERLEVPAFGRNTLQLSDILLASSIQPDSTRPVYALHGMQVVPNLFGAFAVDQPVFVYFEIYNLHRTEGGLTRYRIEHLVRPDIPPQGVISKLFAGVGSLFGGGHQGAEEIATSYEYVGDSPDASQYNSIQLGHPRTGTYKLIVRVTDLVSGATTESRKSFQLVEANGK